MKFREKIKKDPSEKKEKKTSFKEKIKGSFNKKYIKNGSYSMVISAVFIAAVVVINMIVGAVPSKYSEIDVSDQKIFSIGDQTEKFLKKLANFQRKMFYFFWKCTVTVLFT